MSPSRLFPLLMLSAPMLVVAAPKLDLYDSAPSEPGKDTYVILRVSNPDDCDYYVASPTITDIPFYVTFCTPDGESRLAASERFEIRRARLRAGSSALIDANISQTLLRSSPVRFRVQLYTDHTCQTPVLTNELLVSPDDLGVDSKPREPAKPSQNNNPG